MKKVDEIKVPSNEELFEWFRNNKDTRVPVPCTCLQTKYFHSFLCPNRKDT